MKLFISFRPPCEMLAVSDLPLPVARGIATCFVYPYAGAQVCIEARAGRGKCFKRFWFTEVRGKALAQALESKASVVQRSSSMHSKRGKAGAECLCSSADCKELSCLRWIRGTRLKSVKVFFDEGPLALYRGLSMDRLGFLPSWVSLKCWSLCGKGQFRQEIMRGMTQSAVMFAVPTSSVSPPLKSSCLIRTWEGYGAHPIGGEVATCASCMHFFGS